MRRAPARAALALLAALAAAPATWAAPGTAAPAAEPAPGSAWRAEFEAICARTQDAMALTEAELRDLVARADRLQPRLEQLGPSERKVYQRWLKSCRDLYQFVLDGRAARTP